MEPPFSEVDADELLVELQRLVVLYGWHIAVLLSIAVPGLVVAKSLLWRWRYARLAQGSRRIRILTPPEVTPSSAEVFWANLVGLLHPKWKRWLLGQAYLSFEYLWTGGHLEIALWVPGVVPQHLIEKAIEAAWPAARTAIDDATRLIPTDGEIRGGALRLARLDHYPLRHEFDDDPLRPLLGAASGMSEGQYAIVQVLARPITGRRLRLAFRAAAALRGQSSRTLVSSLFDLITPMKVAPTSPGPVPPERATEVRAILAKASQPRFEVVIRYAVATAWTNAPGAADSWARGQAHAIASAFAVFTGLNYLDRHRQRRSTPDNRQMIHGGLLSVSELAALAHLPYDSAVPGLARAGARSVAPGPDIPADAPWCKPLGDTEAGQIRTVGLPLASGRHHLQVIGATGVGKSTLLANQILADAHAKRGVIVIDPKGDLALDVLRRLPEGTQLVLFDPDDHGDPPGLNVLSGPDPDLAVDNLVGIFQRIFADSWGPRTDDILRSACLTLRHLNHATLADVPRLLSEDTFREAATAHIRDDILNGFWAWYADLSPQARSQVIGPIMNKLRAFLLRPYVRAIVGVPGPGLDLGRHLDDGGVCLVRLPKGILGEDTTRLLGSMILAKVWEAATCRARLGESARADTAAYVDEAHNFLTLPYSLADMLAEARGYRLSLVLAHQNLAQLPRDMREAVSSNARNKVFFNVSPEDARALARHTLPNLSEHDLAHLGAYQAAIRMVVNAEDTPAFTVRTRPLPDVTPGRETALRRAARLRSGTASATGDPRQEADEA